MESKIVLATRFAPESCQHHWKNFPPSTIASRLNRRWDRPSARSCYSVLFEHDLFGKPVSTFPDHARQTKGKRNAGRRISPNLRALRARLARSVARSPVGVPPRRLLRRTNAPAQLQLRASWDLDGRTTPIVRKAVRVEAGVTRFRPVPVQRVAPQTGHRAGRAYLTQSRPGAAVTSRRPREPHSLRTTGVTGCRPVVERDSMTDVAETGTDVKGRSLRL